MGEFDQIVTALTASPVTRALKEMAEAEDFSSLESERPPEGDRALRTSFSAP
jgi:hypothetical protein